MMTRRRVDLPEDGINYVRWSLWLLTGICFGLVLGFAAGLAKPRVRKD